jgi:hypothetical protein
MGGLNLIRSANTRGKADSEADTPGGTLRILRRFVQFTRLQPSKSERQIASNGRFIGFFSAWHKFPTGYFEGIGSTNQAKGPDEKISGFVGFFDLISTKKDPGVGNVGICTRQNIHSISPLT